MRDTVLERSLRQGAKAAAVALPKGNKTYLYQPAEITFPTVTRVSKALPAVGASDNISGLPIPDTVALSDALLLESLRHVRYLEAQAQM